MQNKHVVVIHKDEDRDLFINKIKYPKTVYHVGDNPEKDDIETGDEHVGRVVAGEFGRLIRPAESGERPQARAEPGVERVLVLHEVDALAGGALLGFGD